MDRADEIAAKTWTNMLHLRDESQIEVLATALREFRKEVVERCAKIAEASAWPGIPAALAHQAKHIAAKIREEGK